VLLCIFPALSTTQRCDWPGVAAVALNFPAEKSSPAAMRPRVVSLHGGRWSVSQTARARVCGCGFDRRQRLGWAPPPARAVVRRVQPASHAAIRPPGLTHTTAEPSRGAQLP